MPLGLAQAAALIAAQHLQYAVYLGRLRQLTVAQYLQRSEADAYPYRLAEAVVLSLRSVVAADPSAGCVAVLGLVSVLAETGASRRLLHIAAGDAPSGAVGMDAMVGQLADASLVGFTVDDAVVAHRLVMRVVREWLAAEGGLTAVAADAVRVLARLADSIGEAWRDPAGARELAIQVTALTGHAGDYLEGSDHGLAANLLRLRRRSVVMLNDLGDSKSQAILAAESLVADCERVLGVSHPDTLTACGSLAYAYQAARKTEEAIALHERTLADRERVLGPSHPGTLTSRNNLATAYRAQGRIGEAVALLENTLADCERFLDTGHPRTLTARNNLAEHGCSPTTIRQICGTGRPPLTFGP